MKHVVVASSLMLSTAAFADVIAPPPAPPAPAPEAPASDPLKEAFVLVETGPNTVATLQKAIALYEPGQTGQYLLPGGAATGKLSLHLFQTLQRLTQQLRP